MESNRSAFLGEFIGTFMLVFFGCSTVAVTVLFGTLVGQFQIAVCWGIAITISIYMTRHLCGAHFNPAVTAAMVASGRLKKNLLPGYIGGQMVGAFIGALLLYALFSPSIAAFESSEGIVRGTWESVTTAKMFGEYYVQPGNPAVVGMGLAAAAELIGTFILVFVIFCLTEDANVGKPDGNLGPVYIGLTVTIIQCIIAPMTQAGINPARDFMPRLVALMFGWGKWSFPDAAGGAFWVYILAPLVGGVLAAFAYTKIAEPNLKLIRKADKRESMQL